ncbi:hypothetical protein [Paenibacillus sp. MBLB4367]|uniref:hypothetical protein n=1 Tax=Paenibacillus sp. MBLB4367 TaxID=3384767 RepID=UPI003907F63F
MRVGKGTFILFYYMTNHSEMKPLHEADTGRMGITDRSRVRTVRNFPLYRFSPI